MVFNILPLALILVTFRSAASLSFNFTTFNQTASSEFSFRDGQEYFNGASVENGTLILTTMTNWTTGRATYKDSIFHLWDSASGRLADFSTHFSFIIDSKGVETYSDGLTFFLAPVDFPMPDVQEGSGLGLVSGQYKYNSTIYPFVAVEFDTFANAEFKDFVGDHVGIDLSSLVSVAVVKWKSSVLDGKLNEAWIDYKAVTKELSVVFTGFDSNETVLQTLNYTVDLRKVLPESVCLGFAAGTGAYSEVHSVKTWSFSSKLVNLNETVKVDPEPSQPPDSALDQPEVRKGRTGLVVGLVVGAFVVVVGLAAFFVWRRKLHCGGGGEDKEKTVMDEEFAKQTGPRRYSYGALARGTSNFDQKNKLGEGGFGGVYKGSVDGMTVAVKRVASDSHQGVKEYASEVRVISQLRHRNLVQLIGWCHEQKELLLVYEFLPNGSLDTHLFKSEVPLTWALRYKIAEGLASALLYLHEGWDQYVVHRDIKSSNIMLDSSFNAKLGDFGLARLVDHQKVSETTVLAGTRGYMDPESVITGKTTKQSDVYSFGVVALEIACGRKAIHLQAPENEVALVDWVFERYQEGKLLESVDPKLNGDYNAKELEHLLLVGLWCAQPTQVSRPSIRQAHLVLNFEAPLPTLSTRVPRTLSYFDRPLTKSNEDGATQSSYTNTESSIATPLHP